MPQEIKSMEPFFEDLLSEILAIHNSKKEDYSQVNNRFSNFEYSDYIAEPFPNNYKSFAVLIGTKLSRIANLLVKESLGIHPNNESLDESLKDLATYCVIMWHYYRYNSKPSYK